MPKTPAYITPCNSAGSAGSAAKCSIPKSTVSSSGASATEVAVAAEDLAHVLDRVGGVEERHLGSEHVQAELERGDDAEVVAAPAQRPQEVGVFCGAGTDDAAVGGHHLRADQVVDRHAVLAAVPAHPTVEREAGDAGRGDDTAGGDQAVRLGRGVDIGPAGASLDADPAGARVDVDGAHFTEVDDERTVGDGAAGVVVAAAPDGDRQPVLAGERDGGDVGGGGAAAGDERRPAVDHAVPDATGLVVAWVVRGDHVARQALGEDAGEGVAITLAEATDFVDHKDLLSEA
jgi:hypothetical protein